jgi:hypothetical protein
MLPFYDRKPEGFMPRKKARNFLVNSFGGERSEPSKPKNIPGFFE